MMPLQNKPAPNLLGSQYPLKVSRFPWPLFRRYPDNMKRSMPSLYHYVMVVYVTNVRLYCIIVGLWNTYFINLHYFLDLQTSRWQEVCWSYSMLFPPLIGNPLIIPTIGLMTIPYHKEPITQKIIISHDRSMGRLYICLNLPTWVLDVYGKVWQICR